MNSTIKLLSACVALGLHSHASAATSASASDAAHMRTIEVTGKALPSKSSNQNVTKIDAQQLEHEMAGSLEDAIRYVPGVSVVDIGRFGDNGFNIRGIEGDRVAMTIDGLSMSESVESNPHYEFFRAGRGGLDIDALKSIEVIKGADSISAGSGALGGAVTFVSKDPYDYLQAQGNDTHVGLNMAIPDTTTRRWAA